MNYCAFCGPTYEEMSPEDLFPSWLSRLCQRHLKTKAFRPVAATRNRAPALGPRSQRINVRLPVVCKPCNTQWMSQIENYVKPILTRIILNPSTSTTLNDEECAALIIWMAIKAVVVDHADSRASGTPLFF